MMTGGASDNYDFYIKSAFTVTVVLVKPTCSVF